ncbi:hypothetical protein AGLY_003990 [Aphis glycines]|uniref:Uncharacterized protein n=1 Tax=Aphis glycines TaxID=307491 RepID=A0A6G0TWZ0_APHGL|nr:hypothetical protein AGLY_003990 [Aphis glycines]
MDTFMKQKLIKILGRSTKMNKTLWVERKTNEQVLKDVTEKRNIIKHILKRKTKLIGHLFKHNTFMKNIFEGKTLGKRSRGRPRTSYFQDLKNLMEVITITLELKLHKHFFRDNFHINNIKTTRVLSNVTNCLRNVLPFISKFYEIRAVQIFVSLKTLIKVLSSMALLLSSRRLDTSLKCTIMHKGLDLNSSSSTISAHKIIHKRLRILQDLHNSHNVKISYNFKGGGHLDESKGKMIFGGNWQAPIFQ